MLRFLLCCFMLMIPSVFTLTAFEDQPLQAIIPFGGEGNGGTHDEPEKEKFQPVLHL